MSASGRRDVLVVGFAVTGRSVAAWSSSQGMTVWAIDDVDPESKAAAEMLEAAEKAGTELVLRPDRVRLATMIEQADRIILSPGVPPYHPVFALAPAEKIVSEIQLGSELAEQARLPLVAVTGTNGKTTVVTLIAAMLSDSGIRAVPAGNIGRPLVEVAAQALADEESPDGAAGAQTQPVAVVEVSSFQLAWTTTFRPRVSCWLNFAPDHLDWHRDLADYAAAKARIWANQQAEDIAVWNDDDEVVREAASALRARSVPVSRHWDERHFGVRDGSLVTPSGETIVEVAELPRRLPHDLANSLHAAAAALSAGGTLEGCGEALRKGVPLPHRIELVAEGDGLAYYDDSKATTPAAVLAAVCGFGSVVLIAGGRNKGLQLSAIPEGLLAEERAEQGPGLDRVRAVVAIGEAATDVEEVFRGWLPVVRAGSMDEAVEAASELAEKGDAVLLSPGCASFDWYRSYQERGDDFARAVRARLRADSSEGRAK